MPGTFKANVHYSGEMVLGKLKLDPAQYSVTFITPSVEVVANQTANVIINVCPVQG